MSLFELMASLLTITAGFAWINHRLIGLPENIGLLLMGLGASLILIAIELLFPATTIYRSVSAMIGQIDFYEAVMHGMLAFLLFAGALHVDLDRLRWRAPAIGVLATVGVLISMAIVATGLWGAGQVLSLPLAFSWCLVFGALIAPTDPVAVLTTLKMVDVPQSLETDMSGEALFNDGVGVVLFTIAVQLAAGGGDMGLIEGLDLLVVEAGGGALLGVATGYVAFVAMQTIDDYPIEVMISLALVTGTYAVADRLGMSGPISVVVAGLLIGNHGAAHAMSDTTKRYVFGFWTLIDEILNAVLFLFIGLEVLVLNFDPDFGWIALIAVPLVLAARAVAVAAPVAVLDRWQPFARGAVPVLIWGGVRGGISVALALSLPDSPARPLILAATYAVVLFTVVVQGLTVARVARRMAGRPPAGQHHG
ncbi:sodium:proton antiporter (plasmid) [Tistrella bauzanensis]|uniref:cation:proton antiporter n=1 Tax=Tistrella bauzanensis TaxID=657419 RepID=UPI00166A6394|nr:sodium:proton antiporter [Tistrella bauzanensis]